MMNSILIFNPDPVDGDGKSSIPIFNPDPVEEDDEFNLDLRS